MFSALIIDADKDAARQIESVLSPYGFEINTTQDAPEAMNLARTATPDIIFLRVELPNVSGFSVCNKLRRNDETKYIPLVMYASGVSDDVFNQHRNLKTHADDYLKIPLDPTTLLAAVGELIPLTAAEEPAPAGQLAVDLEDVPDDEPEPAAPASSSDRDFELGDATDAAFDALVDFGEAEDEPAPEPAPEPVLAVEPEPEPAAELPPPEPEPEPAPVVEPSAATPLGDLKAKREVLQLKTQLNAKNRELLSLRDDLEAQQRAVLDAKHRNRELLSQIGDLEEKLLLAEEQVINATEEAQRVAAGTAGAQEELTAARAKIGNLEQQITELRSGKAQEENALAERLADLENQVVSLTGERDAAQAQLAEAGQELASVNETLSSTATELEQAKRELEVAVAAAGETSELQGVLDDARAQLAEAQAGAQQQIDAIKQELEQERSGWQTRESTLQQELDEARQLLDTRRDVERRAQRALAVALHVLDGQPTT